MMLFLVRKYRVVIKNIFSLSSVQFVNHLLPLVLVPYLIRVVGIEKYGILAIVTAVIAYFVLLTNYSFDSTATHEIAANSKNKQKINATFNTVLTVQLLLVIIGFVLLFLAVYSIPYLSAMREPLLFAYLIVLGKVLLPIWLFQGMQQMEYVAMFNAIARLPTVVCVIVFVTEPQDYIYVPLIEGIGYIAAGLMSLYKAKKLFNLRLHIPKLMDCVTQLRDGRHLFFSTALVNAYQSTNTLILGIMTSNLIVGYYSVAYKIISAVNQLYSVVSSSIFPHLTELYSQSAQKFFALSDKLIVLYLVIGTSGSGFVFFFKEKIVSLITGKIDSNIIELLAILSILLITNGFGGLFTKVFIAMNQPKIVFKVVLATCAANLIVVFPAIYYFSSYGLAAVLVVVGWLHVLLYLKWYLKYRKAKGLLCVE